jgi:acetyltransferase-like isoleucine patch superfamily enzyme
MAHRTERGIGQNVGSNSVVRRPWFWYNRRSIRIGKEVNIGRESLIEPINNYAGVNFKPCITIGNGTYIGRYCQLHAVNLIEIGDECVLSDHVYISDIAHGMEVIPTPIMKQPLESSFPAGSIIGGSPARIIRMRPGFNA